MCLRAAAQNMIQNLKKSKPEIDNLTIIAGNFNIFFK
jgi:hypothetical protein